MRIILLGDQAVAGKWLGLAKHQARMLLVRGHKLSRVLTPTPGVTIHIQTLTETDARITIKAEPEYLVFSAGFDGDRLHVKMARDYDRPFKTRLTVPPEPGFGEQGPFVDRFENLGEGQGLFIEGANSGLSLVYVLENRSVPTAKVIAVLQNIPIGSRTLRYIGKYDGKKRIISMFSQGGDPARPRVAIFGTDSLIYAQGPFPLSHESLPNTRIEPVYFAGNKTLLAVVRFYSFNRSEYILARSTDGGFDWDQNEPDGLSDMMTGNFGDWNRVRMTPLPGGKMLAIGPGDPTPDSDPGRRLLSFLSTDRGASFNAISIVSEEEGSNHPYFDPVAIDADSAVLVGSDQIDNAIIYRTTNAGGTWENLGAVADGVALVNTVENVTLLEIGVLGMVVWADGEMRLYVSKDSGETWEVGQRIATAPLKPHFSKVLRIGTLRRPFPPNPAIPDLYENTDD